MRELLIAFGATGIMFIVKWFRDSLRHEREARPLRQEAALTILRERDGGPLSSFELMVSVEMRVPGVMGFGTWFRLMDQLVDQGQVRKVWRERSDPNTPRWFGYQLAGE